MDALLMGSSWKGFECMSTDEQRFYAAFGQFMIFYECCLSQLRAAVTLMLTQKQSEGVHDLAPALFRNMDTITLINLFGVLCGQTHEGRAENQAKLSFAKGRLLDLVTLRNVLAHSAWNVDEANLEDGEPVPGGSWRNEKWQHRELTAEILSAHAYQLDELRSFIVNVTAFTSLNDWEISGDSLRLKPTPAPAETPPATRAPRLFVVSDANGS